MATEVAQSNEALVDVIVAQSRDKDAFSDTIFAMARDLKVMRSTLQRCQARGTELLERARDAEVHSAAAHDLLVASEAERDVWKDRVGDVEYELKKARAQLNNLIVALGIDYMDPLAPEKAIDRAFAVAEFLSPADVSLDEALDWLEGTRR